MPTHSKLSSLPFELLDFIAGCLRDDVGSQRSCNLVCKDWHDTFRRHIFQRIILRERSDHPYERFLNLIQGSPEVLQWIHELQLDCNWCIPVDGNERITGISFAYRVIDFISRKPNTLRTLHFRSWQPPKSDYRESRNFFLNLSKLEGVRHLKFNLSTVSGDHLLSFIGAFPHLSALTFTVSGVCTSGNYQHASFTSNTPIYYPNTRLQVIHLELFLFLDTDYEINESPESQRWNHPMITKQLRSLTLELWGGSQLTEYGVILGAAGGTLEHVDLRLSNEFWKKGNSRLYHALLDSIRFSGPTSLQSLNLNDPISPSNIEFLSQLPNPRLLQKLSFVVRFTSISRFRNKDFVALDEYLCSPEFSGLSEVFFTYLGLLDEDIVEKKLKRVFKHVDGRGVLHVKTERPKDFDPHRSDIQIALYRGHNIHPG